VLVRGLERLDDLQRQLECFCRGRASATQPVLQGLSLDEFQHEKVRAGVLLEPVDRGDVGMIQRCQEPGLPLEAREAVGVADERRRKRLDRDVPAQSGVARSPDLAHTALADGGDHVVVRECRSGADHAPMKLHRHVRVNRNRPFPDDQRLRERR
jgi:hypothetical protein